MLLYFQLGKAMIYAKQKKVGTAKIIYMSLRKQGQHLHLSFFMYNLMLQLVKINLILTPSGGNFGILALAEHLHEQKL